MIGITLLASGCSAHGGIPKGLPPAPERLEGEIHNDTYMAKDKSFSIAVPHKKDSSEYKYMQVREQYLERAAYVSFGPAALDQSVYRFEIGRPLSLPHPIKFEEVAPKIVEGYNIQLQKGYGTIPETLSTSWENVNGKKAYHCIFKQIIPAGVYLKDREAVFIHETYVINFEKAVAITWVQIPETTAQTALAPKAFAESAVLH